MSCAITILAVDDERDFLESIRRALLRGGFHEPLLESDPTQAAILFEQKDIVIDVALLDMTMPNMSGEDLLEHIRFHSPDTECIMITAHNDAATAVRCLKKGAYEYLIKPISPDILINTLLRTLERKRLIDLIEINKKGAIPTLKCASAFKSIVSKSVNMLKILKEAELHALSDVPILITGESGVGKELLARAIHAASTRAKYPFTPVNMAALQSNLFDAEFFGHTKGAFTNAIRERKGYLESTGQGSLFLDEIGSTPIESQGKLLRVLQDGEFLKIGTNIPRKSTARFIAATNADLDSLLASGTFRKDFYYRLKGAWLHLPPLRDRRDDIPLLVRFFLNEFAGSGRAKDIDPHALKILTDYHFPGNIRELKFIIQGAVNLSRNSPLLPKHLPEHLRTSTYSIINPDLSPGAFIEPLHVIERRHILKAYKRNGYNKMQTAKCLQIGLNTLRRKLRSFKES